MVLTWCCFSLDFGDRHETCSKHRTSYLQVFQKINISFVIKWQVHPSILLKKIPVQVFSCKFHEIFENTYFIVYLQTNDSENQRLSFFQNLLERSSTLNKQFFQKIKYIKWTKRYYNQEIFFSKKVGLFVIFEIALFVQWIFKQYCTFLDRVCFF